MTDKWHAVRQHFGLDPGLAHFANLVFTSHPSPVSRAVDRHRDILDADGFRYFQKQSAALKLGAIEAAARYFAVSPGQVALTTGTTLGLAQIIGGVRIRPDQEFLTSVNEHPAIVDTLALRERRECRPPHRTVELFRESSSATEDEIIGNLTPAVTAATRVIVLTWVYSSDGVKLPVARIARELAAVNCSRAPEDRALLVIDGVHGFGVEDTTFPELGCDLFVAGTHKSVFAPRGTGVMYGTPDAWQQVVPWIALLASPGGPKNPAWDHIPGGVRAYEHQWAMADAFAFHMNVLGKADVCDRIRALVEHFRSGLESLAAVTVVTPADRTLSSGLLCLDVRGHSAPDVVRHLERSGVIASTSAPDPSGAERVHVRFGVSVINTEADIDRAVQALARL